MHLVVVSALTPEGPYTIMSLMLDLSSRFSLADIHLPVGHFLMCVNSTGLVGVLCANIATPVVLNGLSGVKPKAATPLPKAAPLTVFLLHHGLAVLSLAGNNVVVATGAFCHWSRFEASSL